MTKIMVVDDEPDIIFLIRKILEKAGYEVTEALSGEEALEKVKKEKPDLILMDVMMPGIDGVEAARKIKEDDETKHIPIIMVTVKTEEEDMIRSFQQAHCDAHVGKPIIREKLLKTIEWVLKTKKRWEGDK